MIDGAISHAATPRVGKHRFARERARHERGVDLEPRIIRKVAGARDDLSARSDDLADLLVGKAVAQVYRDRRLVMYVEDIAGLIEGGGHLRARERQKRLVEIRDESPPDGGVDQQAGQPEHADR